MDKTILIVGGIRQAHKYYYDKGFQVIWFGTMDNCEHSDCKAGARLWFNFNINEPIETYIATAKALHHCITIDLVVGFHDKTQLLAGQIAQSLGVQCNVDMEATRNALDKSRTRQLMQADHPDMIYRVIDSEKSGSEFIGQLGTAQFPLIFKPLKGTASEGVYKITDAQQGALLLQQVNDYPYIAESFISGQEFSIESFSEDGQHRVLSITEKKRDDHTFIETAHFQPAALTSQTWQRINDYTCVVLSRLKIDNGPSHTEVIIDQRDGQPILVETHTRTGGDFIPEMVEMTTGINMFELMARQALGEKVLADIPAPVPNKSHVAISFFIGDKTGVVQHIEGKDFLQQQSDEDENLIAFELDVQVGQQIKPMGHSDDRLGYLVYKADSAEKLRTSIEQLLSKVVVAIA